MVSCDTHIAHREERLDSHEVLHFRSYLIGEPQVGAASYKKHRSRRVLRAKSWCGIRGWEVALVERRYADRRRPLRHALSV